MLRRTMLTGGVCAVATLPFARARAATIPVVLELFTSEGCSSCPPAERYLGVLSRRPGVIALAFHVDYWDRFGWHDRFSSSLATERQRAYAAALSADVYTPALVVNGARIMVGSDRDEVEGAIRMVPPASVPVAIIRQGDRLLVSIGPGEGKGDVWLATYDPEATTPVAGGENAGRRLVEYRIVRRFEKLGAWTGAAWQAEFSPAGPAQGQAVLLQGPDLRILGAADAPAGATPEPSARAI